MSCASSLHMNLYYYQCNHCGHCFSSALSPEDIIMPEEEEPEVEENKPKKYLVTEISENGNIGFSSTTRDFDKLADAIEFVGGIIRSKPNLKFMIYETNMFIQGEVKINTTDMTGE